MLVGCDRRLSSVVANGGKHVATAPSAVAEQNRAPVEYPQHCVFPAQISPEVRQVAVVVVVVVGVVVVVYRYSVTRLSQDAINYSPVSLSLW